MSFANYRWEAIGREYNSPYLRNRIWTESFFRLPALLGIPRVAFALVSRNNEIEYLTDTSTWARAHKELKATVLREHQHLEKAIDISLAFGEELNLWTAKHLFEQDLSRLSGQELIGLLEAFVDRQKD